MVQGRLLTTHPGGVHGGGEAPGGDPPLRQGAGKSSPGAPDLGSAAAAEQRSCAKDGVIAEVRKREHYEKPSVKRKKKSEAARKRKY